MEELQVRVISFNPNTVLLSKLKNMFPNADVNHHQAVNLKRSTADKLCADNTTL